MFLFTTTVFIIKKDIDNLCRLSKIKTIFMLCCDHLLHVYETVLNPAKMFLVFILCVS